MRTKEFIKKVKKLGFEIRVEYGGKGELVKFRIGDGEEDFVIIWPKFTFAISTIEYGFVGLKYPLPLKELYKLCFEYASTSIEDREEEKKFYLRHKYLRFVDISAEYFTICTSQKFPFLEDKAFSDGYNQQFTLKEIEEIKERFDTDLADFELVEVED